MSNWKDHVESYMSAHACTYKEALVRASRTYYGRNSVKRCKEKERLERDVMLMQEQEQTCSKTKLISS